MGRRREAELDQPGAIERLNRKGVTVKHMIEQYLAEIEKVRPLGKTKKATLNAIAEFYKACQKIVGKFSRTTRRRSPRPRRRCASF